MIAKKIGQALVIARIKGGKIGGDMPSLSRSGKGEGTLLLRPQNKGQPDDQQDKTETLTIHCQSSSMKSRNSFSYRMAPVAQSLRRAARMFPLERPPADPSTDRGRRISGEFPGQIEARFRLDFGDSLA